MDQRRAPIQRKHGLSDQNDHARANPARLLHAILGFVLIAAGSMKLYEFGTESTEDSAEILLLMVFSEAELVGGVWLIGGFDPVPAHALAIATFAGLIVASLFQIAAGRCSCGCFGTMSINPWVVLILDVAAVATLARSRLTSELAATVADAPIHLFGFGIVSVGIAVGGWLDAGFVTMEGTVMSGEEPLRNATLRLTWRSEPIELSTDADGRFSLPLIRPGLYAVTAIGGIHVASPTSEQTDRETRNTRRKRPAKKAVATNKLGASASLLWVEIPECSDFNKTIKF